MSFDNDLRQGIAISVLVPVIQHIIYCHYLVTPSSKQLQLWIV